MYDFQNDILEKTSGEVRILNGVGQDYEDIISLLVMQAMEGSNDKGKIEELVKTKLSEISNKFYERTNSFRCSM